MTDAPTIEAPRPARRGRATASIVLLVLGCIFVPLTVLGVWARNQALDTDKYVDTVAPLAHDPAIQQLVADRVTASLVANADLKARAEEALPERAKPLAGVVAAAVQRVAHDRIEQFVASDRFAELWKRANRRAHEQLVYALTGEGKGVVGVQNGQVVVNLQEVALRARQRLADRGIDLGNRPVLAPARVVIADTPNLGKARKGAHWLDQSALFLPFITLGLLGGSVALARDRRRATGRVGIGVVIAVLVFSVLIVLGRSVYLDQLPRRVPEDAGRAFFDTMVANVRTANRVLIVLGLLIALAASFVGGSRAATASRARLVGLVPADRMATWQPWLADHRRAIRAAVLAVAALVLVVVGRPSAGLVLVLVIVVMLVLVVLEVLSRAEVETPPEAAPPEPPRTPPESPTPAEPV
jgi:hypothetical protein